MPSASESEDLVALSGLQHLIYCERQAALIHVERVWREDAATASGRILHERADLPGLREHGSLRTARAVELRSQRLRLTGRADVVEYHRDTDLAGGWRPYPVEYKHGQAKSTAARHGLADRVQLCAQAICLEELHQVEVPRGALFYGASHRRVEVTFDAVLRQQTEAAALRLHELIRLGLVPRVARAPKCRACSLEPICLPDATGVAGQAGRYLAALLAREDA
jgi:CRISPR-associated exonuclease Cas4